MAEPISRIAAIKEFFSTPGNPVSMDEMKALSEEDKDELGPPCAEALGRPYGGKAKSAK